MRRTKKLKAKKRQTQFQGKSLKQQSEEVYQGRSSFYRNGDGLAMPWLGFFGRLDDEAAQNAVS
ncbi:hypothetical protein [Methylocella tundrae]|uniref:Uncharacterized protein n=1 Tax=Methylocella tundrae TaxID=227605 RepID=A0A4U8Z116_METTU|nr:hypothetical protein [Methylocella tundrae]WPP06300.1 hypothetical protein SIN04_11085 [Methylocella tundrae]VFU08986.1 protein of unknown function [Methylocella tundrae]